MSTKRYSATKTKDPGRDRYSVIFRHPRRLDTAGKPGRRVRRGLGTSDEEVADRRVSQINEMLSNEEYWSVTARPMAEGRFDAEAVSAFYEGLEPTSIPSTSALRDAVIPLPSKDDDYRRVMLLGTTGAGKTTLVRQLLGTDPERDRFPSTSTAKTTIADTEVVVAPGSFRAVVTFYSRDEVIDHLMDCASKAALAALRGETDAEVRRLLLDHENQRFRFSYVLGRTETVADKSNHSDMQFEDLLDDDSDDSEASSDFEAEPGSLDGIDLAATATIIASAISTLRTVVGEHVGEARAELGVATEEDERVAQEILEENLDRILRSDEEFNRVVDTLVDEIEKRFDALSPGTVARDQQGWPRSWTWESDARIDFLKAVNRFSSNYAPLFGHLLTPLVDGIRVAGPFVPEWAEEAPKLVLIDGEGLGHTPKSSAALPTTVARRIEDVDAVLLVDSAAQPIQAAPASAIRSILTSGDTDKLIFCFTHFDQVQGDNLRTAADRAQHVLSSVENLLGSIRDEFGPRSERALRKRLDGHRVFLSGIDKPVVATTAQGRQAIGQLKRLLTNIESVTERVPTGPTRPIYDKANLVLAIAAATASFHRRWRAVLGIANEADVGKEHWTRVKALNRRFAEGTADQYDTLRPASDLRELLKEEVYKTLESPLRWNGTPPTDDEVVTAIINEFSQAIAKRLFDVVRERLSVKPQASWQDAYSLRGAGSTFVRARRISEEIFLRQAPTPGASVSPDKNEFLHSTLDAVEAAANEIGVELT